MPAIELLLTEPPIPQQRPRFIPSLCRVYDAQSKQKKKSRLLLLEQLKLARQQNPKALLPIGLQPVEVIVCFYTKFPAAVKKERFTQPDIKIGDVDNYLKYLLDILQPDVLIDDKVVWKATSTKIHCENPRTEVSLIW